MKHLNGPVRPILGMLLAGMFVSACASAPQTPEAIKAFLNQPMTLLVVMYIGALTSALTTVADAKRNDSTITYKTYLSRWETILAAVLAVPIAWAGLIFLDQLNFAAAAAWGAIANTGMDKIKAGGRSAALKE